jgi:outer membrane protein OmpA-like peptidoglycan-associated protein
MINWDDPALGKPEQAKILVPLSRARAAAIAKALSARGLGASRMIIEGVGAADPVVPDGDLVNRWKNRRVEFYLEK